MKYIVLIGILLINLLTAQNNKHFKKYKFQSGMIFYDVKVSSFDNHLNSQVRGIARLVFDHWGARELKEEDVGEVQSGDFNDTRTRHTLNLIDFGTVYDVDFDEKVIYKARDKDMDLALMQRVDISDEEIKKLQELGAKKVGKEKIAGYECDLWRYNDQEVCLYKGLPLKILVQNAGFISEKKAVQVILNKQIPAKEFALPNFPIKVDGEYSNTKASLVRTKDFIDSIHDLKEEMKKRGINLADKNLTITPQLQKDIINILGRRYLHKQKILLPKLLVALQNAKTCIAKAQNETEARKCVEPIRKIDDLLGDAMPQYDFSNLTESKKQQILQQIEREYKNTKITADCVSKFDKTTDVIKCTEGKLFPEN